ncbi:MAG: TlpA disulfide reductase family protein [Myxococcota bacterium]
MKRPGKRLPVFLLFALLSIQTAACKKQQPSSFAPQPSRVNAIAAKAPKKLNLEAFCDVRDVTVSAPMFELPAVDTPSTSKHNPTAWRWINVWASWCKPCVEELPMLQRWLPQLRRAGIEVEVTYLSVDEQAADMAPMLQKYPQLHDSLRITEIDALASWVQTIGLDAGATIPIHVFVAPDGRVRCVRTGGLQNQHYDAVNALLKSVP